MSRPFGALIPPSLSVVSLRAFLVLVVFGLITALYSALPLIGGSTEAREGQVVSVIIRTGEWLLPLRNGIVPSKPILYHWVSAILASLFSEVTEGILRMPSILAAMGVIILTTLLGYQTAYGGNSPMQKRRGLVIGYGAGILLTLSYGFVALAGEARTDMVFAFCVTLAAYAILRRFSSATISSVGVLIPVTHWDLSLFFFACGLGVLARGPLGLLLPVLIVFGCLISLFGIRRALAYITHPRWEWLICIAIAAPWYTYATIHGSEAFIGRQLVFENLSRFLGGEHINQKPWWFYIPSFISRSFPWSLIFLLAVWQWIKPHTTRVTDDSSSKIRHLGAIWFLTGLVFFSVASGKRHSYLVPLEPGLALASMWYLWDWYERSSERVQTFIRFLPSQACRVIGALAVVLAGLCSLAQYHWMIDAHLPAYVAQYLSRYLYIHIWLCVSLAVLCIWFGSPKRTLGTGSQLCVAWFALELLFAFAYYGGQIVKNGLKQFPKMAYAISSQQRDGEQITVIKDQYDEYFDPFFFYLNKDVRILPPTRFDLDCSGVFVSHRQWFDRLLRERGPAELKIEVSGRYRQIPDEILDDDTQEVVSFRCYPVVENRSTPHETIL